MEFLASLNTEFDQVRVQILSREKLHSLNEVFAMVRSEENRRVAMLSEPNTKGSAMVSNKGEGARLRSGRSETKTSNCEGLRCTYCKKPRHTQDTCFKLHGKETVLSRIKGFKSLASKN